MVPRGEEEGEEEGEGEGEEDRETEGDNEAVCWREVTADMSGDSGFEGVVAVDVAVLRVGGKEVVLFEEREERGERGGVRGG